MNVLTLILAGGQGRGALGVGLGTPAPTTRLPRDAPDSPPGSRTHPILRSTGA